MLRIAPIFMIAILIGPVLAGLFHIIVPAFGHDPELGQIGFSLQAFYALKMMPAIMKSIWLSYWLGLMTAFISLMLVAFFIASYRNSYWFLVIKTMFKPVLAMPHAAAAFGLAFLIMPSGFIIRLISPELTGFIRPPDWLIINDPAGFALLLGLVIKEIPFLLLVILASLPQVEGQYSRVARISGYGKNYAWLISVFPLIYKKIRLPIYALIAFATSVVDVALILGPATPPPLSIQILRLMSDPDLTQRSIAAAAAIVQFGVTILALITWWIGEKIFIHFGKKIIMSGFRFQGDKILGFIGFVGVGGAIFMTFVGLFLLALWSVSGIWKFPQVFPAELSFSTWHNEASQLLKVSWRAIIIAFFASFIAIILALSSLENEYQRQIKLSKWAKFILFLPLLVPQVSFLFGLFIIFLWHGLDGNYFSLIFAHLIFTLPYVYLLLSDSWNGFDIRYLTSARLMGKSQMNVFFSIRLPMLLRPILMAFALGFAISIAQYLPTLLIGAGRFPTITTEAVALASGGNRRLIGTYSLVQTLLPFVVFAIAALIPALLFHNRKGLNNE